MLRRTYDWTMGLAAHRHATSALVAVAFIESSFFPIPPDVLLIPMILAARERAWTLAGLATLASVLGGMMGYGIGYYFYEAAAKPLIDFYGYGAKFGDFQLRYQEWGAWIVFVAGVTPFPYKVITITSGVVQLDLFVFTVASVLARGLRFFVLAGLLWYFGPPIRDFIERRLGLVFTVFCILLVGGFIVARYLL